MSDPIMQLLMTNEKVLIGACALTAGLFTVNRYLDYKIRKGEENEEKEEREMIEKLKKTLPESTLRKYGLSKY